MRRPASPTGKAYKVYALLVGRGVLGATRDRTRGNYIDVPGYQIKVAGLAWHNGQSDSTTLRQMSQEKSTTPVAIRLIDPEVERGVAVMRLEDWVELMRRAQHAVADDVR